MIYILNVHFNVPEQVMKQFDVKNIIFSSSATVYGSPQYLPVDEEHPVGGCTNAYGKTKFFIEEIIKDVCNADKVSGPLAPVVFTYCAGSYIEEPTSKYFISLVKKKIIFYVFIVVFKFIR